MGSGLKAWDRARSSLLAIEAATACVSVVVQRGGSVIAERVRPEARHHAEILLPLVDEVLCESGIALGEVDGFAVSIGPGTFTSLRTGLSTVKGLAFGSDAPVAGVSTLAALAHAGTPRGELRACVAVLDARRGEVYAGAFETGNGASQPLPELLPEGVYRAEQLTSRLSTPLPLLGEGATQLGRELAEHRPAWADSPCTDLSPRAASVAELGARLLEAGQGISAASLVPRYLRRAQAEEDRIAAGR